MDTNSRFLDFCKEKNIRQVDFVNWKFTSNQTINTIFKKGVVPNISIIEKLAEKYPDLNLRWLLTGNGQMLISEQKTIQTHSTEDCPNCETYKEHLNLCIKEKAQLLSIMENLTLTQEHKEKKAS